MEDVHVADTRAANGVDNGCPATDRNGHANAYACRQPPAADACTGHREPDNEGETDPYESWEVEIGATAVGRRALQNGGAGRIEDLDGARLIAYGE